MTTSTPTKLLFTIISHAWESPLTPYERIHFMISSMLVSSTWTAVFDDISAADLHVPCESFYHHYFRNDSDSDYSRCKRVTFTIYDPDCQHHPYARTLSYMRHADMAKLTSLHSIRIVFHDSVFPDPYAQGFFSALPAYLPTLVVSYTFSRHIPTSFIEHYRKRFERKSKVRYAEPRVGTLVVDGADEFIAAVWESLFPGRKRLIRDGEESERLMKVASIFSIHQALLVRLEDIQRRRQREEEDASHQQQTAPALDGRPLRVRRVDGDEQTFITANPAHDPHPHFLSRTRVGDVGYVDPSSGQFVPLFNAREPHIMPSSTMPSLSGYGDAHVRCRLTSSRKASDSVVGWLAHFAQVVFKFGGTKTEYVDASEGGAAVKWFKATAASVVGVFGKMYNFSAKDVVLVTGRVVH